MIVVCLDLEGVLIPEIWIALADRTGIDALRRTTRDEPDYDALMRGRLAILDEQGLRLPAIEAVIATLTPLRGAAAFLDELRERAQVVILSDTFYEFADPLMRQLGRPTLLCNRLTVAPDGRITGYRLRMPDHKRASVAALQGLRFEVRAAGDSYNDLSMLSEADRGVLFRAPAAIAESHPRFPATDDYGELLRLLLDVTHVSG